MSQTMLHDDDLFAAITESDEFRELPVSIHTVEPLCITGVRVDHIDASSGLITELQKHNTPAWTQVLRQVINQSTRIEDIEPDPHSVVTHWQDSTGTWHETLEGEILRSIIEE